MSVDPMHQRRNRSQPGNNMYRNNNYGNYNNLESGRGGGDTNANILEQQNNERINELSSQVAKLKGLTIAIGNEVNEQNSFLDDMGDTFGQTGELLAGSLRRIGTMLETGGAKHMCYMVGFFVCAMIFLYWLMTHKGKSGI